MLRAINHNEKTVICCPFVCGTSYLQVQILKNDNYEHYRGNWPIPDDYRIYKVVRNPLQRWHSWYNKFIIKNKFPAGTNEALVFIDNSINKKNMQGWFDKFKVSMHYDGHTGLQKYLHKADKRFNNNNTSYILSSHLQVFLGTSNKNFEDKIHDLPLRQRIDKYLQELYLEDIEWINSLEIVK